MSLRRLMLACALIALLGGCGPSTPPANDADATAKALAYVRDDRTALCFAVVTSDSYGGWEIRSIASVPCSPEVLQAAGHGGSK